MDRLTVAFLRESGVDDCPMLEGDALEEYRAIMRASSDFSLHVRDWLDGRPAPEQVAWLKTSMQASRDLFQPWSMEILYAIAVLERARFTQLEALLGIGSKTLTARLKTLQSAGFVTRTVYDETPVRIEYALSKAGRATAALASPLFTHLNIIARSGGARQ